MPSRKVLTTVALTEQNMLPMLNREVVPVLRQVVKATAVTGSRAGAPVAILTALLTILSNAGIITDQTTP